MRYEPGESEQWPEAEKNKSADSANKREKMEVVWHHRRGNVAQQTVWAEQPHNVWEDLFTEGEE